MMGWPPPRRIWNLLATAGLLLVLGGCAALESYLPTEPVSLTAAQRDRIGDVVSDRLLQILGGPYHEAALNEALTALTRPSGCRLAVADRSAVEIFPLPGRRVVVTRGLLAQLQSRGELAALLEQAASRSDALYQTQVSSRMAAATRELLTGAIVEYDPQAADIRLAQLFADDPCKSCLAAVTSGAGGGDLPGALAALKDRLPGYRALSQAGVLEESGLQREAIAAYLEAATLSPDESKILGALGLAYLRAGQQQPARLHLEKSVRLQDGYYRTQMGLGYLYLQSGQLRNAEAALAESVRLLPQLENLFLLAEARQKSGDAAGAESLYRFIISKDRSGKLGRSAAERLPHTKGAE